MITPDNKFLWNDHSKDIPEGTHAIIGASKYAWVNYDRESLENSVVSYYSPAIGTILHGLVSKLIRTKIKVNRTEARKLILLELLINGIPRNVIDVDQYVDAFTAFVNDAISYDMQSEQPVKYSGVAFGTSDAIQFYPKKSLLRVHDYKSGTGKVKMTQLYIYAAFFCLEYHMRVMDLNFELRIYQMNDILVCNPEPQEILDIMDILASHTKIVEDMTRKG